MFENALILKTKKMLREIQKFSWLKDFYLAGGTAAALYFGHRKSEDLDFFSSNGFEIILIRSGLQSAAPFRITDQKENNLSGVWGNVKLSFMRYPYKLVGKAETLGKVRVASIEDIALMKLDAICTRGTKRDFIDLYWISKYSGKTLLDSVRLTKKKFGKDYSIEHLIKSLSYFLDADKQPMPLMLKKISWEEVKSYFIYHSMSLARKFMFDL